MAQMNDLVLIELTDGNIGTHGIIGPNTKTNYAYHSSGEQFYVRAEDANSFVASGQAKLIIKSEPVAEPEATPSPAHALADIWGMNDSRIRDLAAIGIDTPKLLAMQTVETLNSTIGVSSQSASRIISAAQKAIM